MMAFLYAWVIIGILVSLPLLWLSFIEIMFRLGRKEAYEIKGPYHSIVVMCIMILPSMNIATNLFFGYLLLRISGIIR